MLEICARDPYACRFECFYVRSEVLDAGWMDSKDMMVEASFLEIMSPEKLYNVLPNVSPTDRGRLSRPSFTKPNHSHFDDEVLRSQVTMRFSAIPSGLRSRDGSVRVTLRLAWWAEAFGLLYGLG